MGLSKHPSQSARVMVRSSWPPYLAFNEITHYFILATIPLQYVQVKKRCSIYIIGWFYSRNQYNKNLSLASKNDVKIWYNMRTGIVIYTFRIKEDFSFFFDTTREIGTRKSRLTSQGYNTMLISRANKEQVQSLSCYKDYPLDSKESLHLAIIWGIQASP